MYSAEKKRQDPTKGEVSSLTLENAELLKQLQDSRVIHNATVKAKNSMQHELARKEDELRNMELQLNQAREEARQAIQDVQGFRKSLAQGGGGGSLTLDELHSGKSGAASPKPVSRFSAISAYSSSLCADAGLDS